MAVQAHVNRFAGNRGNLVLEVVCLEGSSTVWDEPIATEVDAFQAFYDPVHESGNSVTHSPHADLVLMARSLRE